VPRSPLRALVVDDSAAMRQLLALSAGATGAEVREAGNGVAALKLLALERFDVVFLDLNMPVMDGTKLIQRLRDDPAHAHVRICVVSTDGSDAAEAQARSLGAHHYLKKPVTWQAIGDVLRESGAAR
jgi:two-component system chemotaxis response regulator CheY